MTPKLAIIGDVHGCYDELTELIFTHLVGRQLVFVGDLGDRGFRSLDVIKLVMSLHENGAAKCVLGNHDDKLRRWLKGNAVQVSHGLDVTIRELNKAGSEIKGRVFDFLFSLPYKLSLDEGRLIVAHAGLEEHLQGELTGKRKKRARAMALYGKTTGKTDEDGFPERFDWAEDYRGEATVVHGHVACEEVIVKNKVWNIDTGCVFGNKLTALLYPEMETVAVHAKAVYTAHKPLLQV